MHLFKFCKLGTWQAFAWIYVCCRCHRLSRVEGTYIIFINYDLFQRGSKKTISRIMKNGPVNPRYQSTMSLSTKWFLRNGDLLKEAFIRNPQTFLRVLALRPRHIFKIPCAQNENLANPRCCENFFEGQMISQGCPRKDGNHTIPLQTTSPQKKESKASKCMLNSRHGSTMMHS